MSCNNTLNSLIVCSSSVNNMKLLPQSDYHLFHRLFLTNNPMLWNDDKTKRILSQTLKNVSHHFLTPFFGSHVFFFWYHLMPQFHVWSPPTPPSPGSTIHCSFICLTWSPVVCRTFSLHPSSLPAPLDYCLFPWHQQQQNMQLEQASTCSSSNGYTTSATSLPPLFLDSFLEPQAGAPFIFGDHSGSNNQNSNHNNNHSNHHTLNHVGSNSYTTTSLPSNHVRLPPFCSIWVTYFISFCQSKVKQKSTLRSQVKNHTDILIFNRCIAN